jgi:cytochrome c biogenesis protein CcdA/thiol-disulfide isomerase/thioredoxin
MLLLIGAFIAGIITVFAPCVFALLPVIIGGSISGDVHDKRRPFIITASLAVSLIVFTLLLKATTLFIDISPAAITYVSGGIIVGIGLLMLFPRIYEEFILRLNLQSKSQGLLGKGYGKGAVVGAIITGAALGPVFSSCSPVYAYILASVLPVDFGQAMAYMIAYVLGLSLVLLLVGFIGQKFVRKLSWASNPKGWFQRIVAVLFIIVGLMVITGYDKKFQTFVSEKTPFDFDSLSVKLIPSNDRESVEGVLNVKAYEAPEFKGLSNWINSEPKTLESLKGKVVLVDFWTYSCINCIRTQPYLKEWYKTYKDSGFEIIGVHAPEFAFEKNVDNVKNAIKDAGLTYPIALDNDFKTWAAYGNQYWPATYLIDKEGNVRRTHFGEGEYKETEQAIRGLLQENGGSVPSQKSGIAEVNSVDEKQTPETYLGEKREAEFANPGGLQIGQRVYTLADLKAVNDWTLGGEWKVSSEGVTAVKDSVLKIRVAAKNTYLVTGSAAPGTVEVRLDGQPVDSKNAGKDVSNGQVSVTTPRLYRVVSQKQFTQDQTIELRVAPGVQLNAFTFGN